MEKTFEGNFSVMSDRSGIMTNFLAENGWGKATRLPLADDASFRRYDRLSAKTTINGRDKAVLMDAPPKFEDVRPFVAVAHHLQKLGLAAPKIIASDVEHGFLLLEDMGNDLFARVIEKHPEQEKDLYELAILGLIHLHNAPPPANIAPYDVEILRNEICLFADWYLPAVTGKPLMGRVREEFLGLWQDIFPLVTQDLNCLILRDYHAENLMLRSGYDGLARLGLLDFQDALMGHPAYDLVSLLQDARRDVSPALEADMLRHYLDETGQNNQNFIRDYAILGAQRNIKIIGIFTRLSVRDGKDSYLGKIAAVWTMLERDLAHPILSPVKSWLAHHIPPQMRAKKFTPIECLPRKAMILAAGLGKRMRPLSENCPKPLVTVAGKELLSYSLDGLCAAGIKDVIINIHYLADQMEDYVTSYYDHRLTLKLSDERAQLMDSGGGVNKALSLLGDEAFFVLNSDMIWRDGPQQMLHRMQAFWQADDMDILMLLINKPEANGYDAAGDYCRNQAGQLTARGSDATADFVYGGIMIMKPSCFDGVPEGPFSLRQQFDQAEQAGRLYGLVHDGDWYHVGTPEMRDHLEGFFNTCQGS